MHITTLGLQSILAAAGYPPSLPHISQLDINTNDQSKRQLWESIFNIKAATTGYDVGNRYFAKSIMTDGVGVSVKIMRPVHQRATFNHFGWTVDADNKPIEPREYNPAGDETNNYRGVDPNRGDIVKVATGEGKDDTFGISLKHYRTMCGFTRATIKRKKWTREQSYNFRTWLKCKSIYWIG
jgi:hypothetical protein